MKNRLAAAFSVFVLFMSPIVAQYRNAIPGYRYEFPRDYFNHPDFQTEWWYYTGNLRSQTDGRRFGFELTFFRQAVSRDVSRNTSWEVHDVYLAHLALSDLDGGHFYHVERTNRAGPGIAGASEAERRIWNGNWQVQFSLGSTRSSPQAPEQQLQAIDPRFELHFTLHSEKPPVINGENGVSQKAQGAGRASYYISLTRLVVSGFLLLEGKKFAISGLAWMDHEFFTRQLENNQAGWDWFSIQLVDGTELMLFRIRRKDGSIDPFSAGTSIDAQGKSTHLHAEDFILEPLAETWISPDSHAVYPVYWKITVPKLGIQLEAKASLVSQEFTTKTNLMPIYWEGAITLSGSRAMPKTQEISGAGYLEMTGYDRPVQLAR